MTVCFPCLRIKWQYGLPCLRIKTVCGVLTYRQFKTFRAQKALFFYRIHSNRFEKRLINSEPTLCIRGGPPAASPVPDLRRANIASPRAAPAAPRAACTFAPYSCTDAGTLATCACVLKHRTTNSSSALPQFQQKPAPPPSTTKQASHTPLTAWRGMAAGAHVATRARSHLHLPSLSSHSFPVQLFGSSDPSHSVTSASTTMPSPPALLLLTTTGCL
jgi:hypothetical protein